MSPPTSQVELLGYDHVDLRVRSREKARHFFVEQLGMDVLGESDDHTFLLFGDQVLGLHDARPGERPAGVDHLALRVATWTGLRSRVRRARIVVVGEMERDDSRSLFLKGPDGLRIELVWRPDPSSHTTPHACRPRTPSEGPRDRA